MWKTLKGILEAISILAIKYELGCTKYQEEKSAVREQRHTARSVLYSSMRSNIFIVTTLSESARTHLIASEYLKYLFGELYETSLSNPTLTMIKLIPDN